MKVLVCFLLALLLLLFPVRLFAQGEFKAKYVVNYAIALDGTATVTQNITLTNQFSGLYPKEYTIVLDTDKIHDVLAYDATGILTPAVDQSGGHTTIVLSFKTPTVGLGKTTSFSLRYKQLSIAQKNGLIWEVAIPGIVDDPDIETYLVTYDAPEEFGTLAYVNPLPLQGRTWTKEQLIHGGVTAAYGVSQKYALTLHYYLNNDGQGTKTYPVAMPPDTAYQKVTIDTLDPLPDHVTKTKEGNWIAYYAVGAHEHINITATIFVETVTKPRESFFSDAPERHIYLKSDTFWEANNPTIQSLAKQLKTPKAIYEYVVATLSYNYDRVRRNPVRLGALGALETPTESLCREFTDLFIAIARAANIPAREVVGYGYTTNPTLRPLSLVVDVLHAWPEYYDDTLNVWVPVDPTWGKTTRGTNYFDQADFNHIVFAIHSSSNEEPLPPGFYRRPGQAGKDVEVNFVDEIKTKHVAKIVTGIAIWPIQLGGFPITATIDIKNTGGISIDEARIHVSSSSNAHVVDTVAHQIPPYSTELVPVSFSTSNLWSLTTGKITARVNDEVTERSYVILPIYTVLVPISAMGLILFLIVRRKKKRTQQSV